MLTHTTRWSHPPGNAVVPSGWQATWPRPSRNLPTPKRGLARPEPAATTQPTGEPRIARRACTTPARAQTAPTRPTAKRSRTQCSAEAHFKVGVRLGDCGSMTRFGVCQSPLQSMS